MPLASGWTPPRGAAGAAGLIALGVAAGLGQAPWGLWPLTLLSLAAMLSMTPADTHRSAALRGWLFGVGYFGLTLHWIVEPFLVEPERDGWLAPFGVTFMIGGMALFWGLAGWLSSRLWPGRVGLAVMLVAVEVLRSHIFTGFPWVLLGHIWLDTPVAQAAAYVGPFGLTGLTVLAAVLLASAAIGPRRWALALIPLAALWALPAPEVTADGPTIRLVQPNVPQAEKWNPDRTPEFEGRLLTMTAADPRPDLIVWPETSIFYLLEYAADFIEATADAASGAPVVAGVNRREGARYYNSLIVIGADGGIGETYDKSHLVPFGEYFPMAELAARFGLHGLAASEGGGFSAGGGGQLLTLPGIGSARALICYEGIFAEEIVTGPERPDLMILITNDAWFGQNAGPRQHLAQARFRAIEQGLPMVRVANTGISAMIDPAGRITGRLELGTAGHLDLPLPAAFGPTIYARFGDLPALLLLIIVMSAGIYRNFRNPR